MSLIEACKKFPKIKRKEWKDKWLQLTDYYKDVKKAHVLMMHDNVRDFPYQILLTKDDIIAEDWCEAK